jgi:hypothetical protein
VKERLSMILLRRGSIGRLKTIGEYCCGDKLTAKVLQTNRTEAA